MELPRRTAGKERRRRRDRCGVARATRTGYLFAAPRQPREQRAWVARVRGPLIALRFAPVQSRRRCEKRHRCRIPHWRRLLAPQPAAARAENSRLAPYQLPRFMYTTRLGDLVPLVY